MLPPASERDPEGQGDQPRVEPEGLPGDVKPVVPELVAPRDVAGRVDLADTRQAGADPLALGVPRDLLEPLVLAGSRDLDLSRPQGPRADEAHVAHEDVPELRQLVHGRRPHQTADACDAGIVLSGLNGPDLCLGIRNHRAELERVERAPPLTSTLLPVEDRPTVFQLDRQGQQCPERGGTDQAETRQDDV